MKEEDTLSYQLLDINLTLTPKPDKGITGKKKIFYDYRCKNLKKY